jgi:tRNA 2-selenouridine synthase
MSLTLVPAAEAIARFDSFDTIIDARSEGEFAEDHLPGAQNWPTLHDEERKNIGTLYKQVNAFEAKKRGAALAARNISTHIEQHVLDKPRDWAPLAYCWRGGKRSGSLSLVLDQIGFRVSLIEGGYKAFRAAMLEDMAVCAARLTFQVICGTTGSGKTRLLQALRQEGAPVLDLEELARHRSSVLGALPGIAQPTQKCFDTLVWEQIRQFDPKRVVFVESESKKVGNVSIHPALVDAMRASPCSVVDLSIDERVELLMEDYAYFTGNPEQFCTRLDALTAQRGKVVIEGWKESVRRGEFRPVVRELLMAHYDPVYLQSMERNFTQFGQAAVLSPADRTLESMRRVAKLLAEAVAV